MFIIRGRVSMWQIGHRNSFREHCVSQRENSSMEQLWWCLCGEQEPWDLTWPSLPWWRTFGVTGNKSHFLDSYTSGHTCTEDKTHTNKKGTRLKSPVHLQQPQHGVGRAAGTAPPAFLPSYAPCSSEELGVRRAERRFQKILEITANLFHTSFWKSFNISPWNRQSKFPRTSNRKSAMCRVGPHKLEKLRLSEKMAGTCTPNGVIFAPRHKSQPSTST